MEKYDILQLTETLNKKLKNRTEIKNGTLPHIQNVGSEEICDISSEEISVEDEVVVAILKSDHLNRFNDERWTKRIVEWRH